MLCILTCFCLDFFQLVSAGTSREIVCAGLEISWPHETSAAPSEKKILEINLNHYLLVICLKLQVICHYLLEIELRLFVPSLFQAKNEQIMFEINFIGESFHGSVEENIF